MGKRNKSRSKPPSRQRYEIKNPTVSARLPVENREKLWLVLRKQGTTLTKLLIAIANEQELKLKPLEEARVTGYQEAKRLYMVYFHCDVCGKPILINNPKIKEAVRQYLSDAGFGHPECHNKPLQS